MGLLGSQNKGESKKGGKIVRDTQKWQKWMVRVAVAATVFSVQGCNRPDRQGVPPEPRLQEDEREPGTAGGAPRTGPDVGPETPAP